MNEDRSFLGTGWGFPPGFVSGGKDVEMVSDAADIHQSLQILFMTQLGERVMREDYGCGLDGFLFEEIDHSLVNRLSGMISKAILHHETRIKLEQLEISESPSEPGLLLISLTYTIRNTNSRYNMVYPFYLKEAVVPGS